MSTSTESSTPKDLLLAILAMDSYNRGYEPGILGLGGVNTKVGSATFVRESDVDSRSAAVKDGFYATAYKLDDGGTVISYRGMDRFSGTSDFGSDLDN